MPIKIEIYPTTRRAILTILIAITVAIGIIGIKRTMNKTRIDQVINLDQPMNYIIESNCVILIPIINLDISNTRYEREWSAALSDYLTGETEVTVESGRADVITDLFAIEVDKLDKWHEAIGQALHYANETEKIPCIALIMSRENWPLDTKSKDKLNLIDKTCLKSGIKLILLSER